MNQYSQNPKHYQPLEENQARHATNCIVKALRKQEWQEDQNKLYLKGIFYNPNLAFVIPEPMLIEWESKLNYTLSKQYDYLIEHKTMLPFTSQGNGIYRPNPSAKHAPKALQGFTQKLHLNGQLEYGTIIKLHWLLIKIQESV